MAQTRGVFSSDAAFTVLAAVSLAVTLVYFLNTGNGIAHTLGSGLVVFASAAFILAGVIFMTLGRRSRGWRITFIVLSVIGILLTAVAGWMLDRLLLVGLMGLMAVALALVVFVPPPPATERIAP